MLWNIFREHRARIVVIYAVLVVEFITFALLPFLLGKAVDALFENDSTHFWIYVGLCLGALIIGFARRYYDTRVFIHIWKSNSVAAVCDLVERNIDNTKIISRANWVRTYADFFEYTFPVTVSAVIDILVSMLMIWLVVPSTATIVLCLLVLAIYLSYHCACAFQEVERKIQNHRELADAGIIYKNLEQVRTEYDGIADGSVRRSDLEALSWGIVDLISVLAVVLVLLAVVQGGQTAGTILATLDYTWKLFMRAGFIGGFFTHLKQLEVAREYLNKEE